MTFIKINDTLYPAIIVGNTADKDWDNRASKSIILEMTHAEAVELFADSVVWSIVQREKVPVEKPIYEVDENGELVLDENGQPIQIGTEPDTAVEEIEYDNSEYNLAGDITDHRDGTIAVKMGKLTELEEAYALMFGGVEDEPIPEDAEIPEAEGNEHIPEDTEVPEGEGENDEAPLEDEGEIVPEGVESSGSESEINETISEEEELIPTETEPSITEGETGEGISETNEPIAEPEETLVTGEGENEGDVLEDETTMEPKGSESLETGDKNAEGDLEGDVAEGGIEQ